MITRVGVRVPGVVFSILGAVGMFLASFAVRNQSLWLYYVALGPCVGLCIGVSFYIAIQHIVRWLVDRRGFAGSFYGFFIGVGAFVLTLVERALVERIDTNLVFVVLGGMILTFNIVPFMIMRLPPAPLGLNTPAAKSPKLLTYTDILQTRRFYLFWVVFVVSLMAGWGIVTTSTVLFTSVGGVSHSTADLLTSFM